MQIQLLLKLLLCLLLVFTTGCIERFNFRPEEPVQLLVVDGRIDQSAGPYELRLSRTSAFGTAPVPVWDARVTLYDDLGNQEEYYTLAPGIYQADGHTVKGQPGRTYHIEIRTEDHTYRSQPQTMPFPVQADSAYFETQVETVVSDEGAVSEARFINVYVDTPTRQEHQDVWFRWRYDVNYAVYETDCGPLHRRKTCYITDTTNTQNISLFSSENTDVGQLSKFLVVTDDTHPRYAFSIRYYVNIYQFSITQEAYQYWEKVKKVANQVGSIFDTPPAPIPGNVYNENDNEETVLGFFEAAAIDTVRTYLMRGDLAPLPVSEFCGYVPGSQPEDRAACCNCLRIKNSTVERPAYWND